jgi:hypothetical protein
MYTIKNKKKDSAYLLINDKYKEKRPADHLVFNLGKCLF